MAALADFLDALLNQGEAVFSAKPLPEPDPAAAALLERAYADYRLAVAGPLLEFDVPTALAAAELVRQACWFLVHHGEPEEELKPRLTLPPPRSPAEHLSADLTLRFLPQLEHRARKSAPSDPLVGLLATVLRQWPLSGVLSDVIEGPLTALDFAGHPGLLLLYGERLAQTEKAHWFPTGAALEYVELAFHARGKNLPPRSASPSPLGGEGWGEGF